MDNGDGCLRPSRFGSGKTTKARRKGAEHADLSLDTLKLISIISCILQERVAPPECLAFPFFDAREHVMERTESVIIQVAPDYENDKIKEMEQFGWNLQGRQEIHEEGQAFGRPSYLDSSTYIIKRTVHHYVKLHFVRSLALPNLEQIRALEQRYFELLNSSPVLPSPPALLPARSSIVNVLLVITFLWFYYVFFYYWWKKLLYNGKVNELARQHAREIEPQLMNILAELPKCFATGRTAAAGE